MIAVLSVCRTGDISQNDYKGGAGLCERRPFSWPLLQCVMVEFGSPEMRRILSHKSSLNFATCCCSSWSNSRYFKQCGCHNVDD